MPIYIIVDGATSCQSVLISVNRPAGPPRALAVFTTGSPGAVGRFSCVVFKHVNSFRNMLSRVYLKGGRLCRRPVGEGSNNI